MGKKVDFSYTLYLHVKCATGLGDTGVFLAPTPNAYVLINGVRFKEKNKPCVGTTTTSVVQQSHHPQFNEDCEITMHGDGAITFSVFSQNSFAGDTFMGQAVVNLA